MLRDEKSLKDSSKTSDIIIKDSNLHVLSYTKTNKLMSALYMVTDIIEKDEPLRIKLRTLGVGIVSDIYSLVIKNSKNISLSDSHSPEGVEIKIVEMISFLDIASSINIISEMNYSILKKEFIELKQSIEEYLQKSRGAQTTLQDLFSENSKGHEQEDTPYFSKGHALTRIGVQKGSTLMGALSKVRMSSRPIGDSNNFNDLKNQRRAEIITFIKENPDGVVITDIRTKSKGLLASVGEKTLQRELVSMVKDNILRKTGSKRWSRYFLVK